MKTNIFASAPGAADAETFTMLLEQQDVKIERIVSTGQRTPDGQWLQQETVEWVVLLSGSARVSFEGEARPRELVPGDYLYIPALVRHRVDWTAPDQQSVWLAVHLRVSGRVSGGEAGPEANRIQTVKVVRSRRRKHTVAARFERDTMVVHVPHTIAADKLDEIIAQFKRKVQRTLLRKSLNKHHDLKSVAEELNRKYFGGTLRINRIEYVTDQFSKFGCCDYRARSIRIAHHVARMPVWVRDYVLIHELAHLIRPDHSAAFWALVNRYRYVERAKGYLLAKGYELNDERHQE